MELFKTETAEVMAKEPTLDGRWGRSLMASYMHNNATNVKDYSKATEFYVWKYTGTDVPDPANQRIAQDAHFIVYRVAEILLMKAEALIAKDAANWDEALALINRVHQRASLPAISINTAQVDEVDMLELVLHEREMEFVAEGKRWYDLVRFGRMKQYKYKELFIEKIVEANQTTNDKWIRSVLRSTDAWFMPLPYSDLQVNPLLIQNPYYATTK